MPNSILTRFNTNDSSSTVALASASGTYSYAQMNAWSSEVAASVQAFGRLKEKPIGVLAPSSAEFAAALTGIWKAGAMAVPLQPQHPVPELQYIVEDSRIEHVLVHAQCLPLAEKLAESCRIKTHLIARSAGSAPPRVFAHPEESDGALIIYTSGTTNRPKGVVSTYGILEAQTQMLIRAWDWSAGDRTLNVLPLHHVHGLVNILCCSLASGARCELVEKFTPELVWARIAAGDINVFMAVPTVYSKLIQHWEVQTSDVRAEWSASARKLRLMVSGSAALPARLSDQWLTMTGHRLLERYGMTEIGMALSNPYIGERKVGTVGVPLPGVSVRLIDDSGQVVSGAEVQGEIQVRGATVFREYLGKPEATAESFTSDAWFRTGDISCRDVDGYYRILGRRSQDIIKSGGYKISALEIESAILDFPGVAEVAVLGLTDSEWGERIAAVYVGVVNESKLAVWLKGRIGHYKVPSVWKRVDTLPRNAMGKVVKPELRKLFG